MTVCEQLLADKPPFKSAQDRFLPHSVREVIFTPQTAGGDARPFIYSSFQDWLWFFMLSCTYS